MMCKVEHNTDLFNATLQSVVIQVYLLNSNKTLYLHRLFVLFQRS